MASSGAVVASHRRNILTLDGGGVRGLTSLLILQRLMQQINSIIDADECGPHREVRPQEIFDLVAGTSTGGLIAIMLGKLGMSVEQCIDTYKDLSANIFAKGHFRGKLVGGLGPSRYSGSRLRNCVRSVIEKHATDPDLRMEHSEGAHGCRLTACAVVCREHVNQSKFSEFKLDPVCICSHRPCPTSLDCLVCDAARATSAAPTYFSVQMIGDRCFVDGGMQYNNPSFAIFNHYAKSILAESSHRPSFSEPSPPPRPIHSSLDFSDVRFVNIGTGTRPKNINPRPKDINPRNRGFLANLVPTQVRMGIFLKTNLVEFAVESEKTASDMKTLAQVSGGDITLKWERFSPSNNMCYIRLDKYKRLEHIETMTRKYLEMEETQQQLRRVGKEIAREYLQRQRPTTGQASLSVSRQAPVLRLDPLSQSSNKEVDRSTTGSSAARPQPQPPSSSTTSSYQRISAHSGSEISGNGDISSPGTTPAEAAGGPRNLLNFDESSSSKLVPKETTESPSPGDRRKCKCN